jgi:3-deoxy-D-manno-octulosonic acid kinase
MRPKSQMQWRDDPDFARIELGRRVLLVHRDILEHAAEIAVRLSALRSAAGAGTRASAFRLNLGGGLELFARRSTRGGIVRHFVGHTFVGIDPRPFRELRITAEARRRGVPAAEPVGAMAQWIAPAVYRGFFLTRAIAGMTLWEFMRTDDDPAVREHVLMKARAAILTMHDRGVLHADLNLHNLMVTQAGESFAVVILDFDKARLSGDPVSAPGRRANAQRLLRSARKLDPKGEYFDQRALSILDVS